MKMIIALILPCLFSFQLVSQDSSLTEFHDFYFKLEGWDNSKTEDYKFEIFSRRHKSNNFLGFVIKSDSLHYIKRTYDENNLINKRDTIIHILTEDQLNRLYNHCVENFKIRPNLTKYPIPPPPKPINGITAQLEFELRFRGEKYIKLIREADFENTSDETFGKLLKWLVNNFTN